MTTFRYANRPNPQRCLNKQDLGKTVSWFVDVQMQSRLLFFKSAPGRGVAIMLVCRAASCLAAILCKNVDLNIVSKPILPNALCDTVDICTHIQSTHKLLRLTVLPCNVLCCSHTLKEQCAPCRAYLPKEHSILCHTQTKGIESSIRTNQRNRDLYCSHKPKE